MGPITRTGTVLKNQLSPPHPFLRSSSPLVTQPISASAMDPRYTGEILKHLDRQSELLMDAYNSMSNQLHELQVEEEMLMRKCYEIMSAQGVDKKNGDSGNVRVGDPVGNSTPSLTNNSNNPNGGHGHSAELVPTVTSKREPEI